MNEQQLADLFSEQLDRLLQGQEVTLPAEAGELHELLGLGQQFAQISFQPSVAAQAAFVAQLIAWFEVGAATGSAVIWGLSKLWVIGLSLAAATIGAGVGLLLLTVTVFNTPEFDNTPQPTAPAIPALAPPLETTANPEPPGANPTATSPVTAGETAPLRTPTSRSDWLSPPRTATASPASSLGDTIALPELASTATPEPGSATEAAGDDEHPPGEHETPGREDEHEPPDLDNEDNGERPSRHGDFDRGHGNDPDGYDEDNPGQSNGLPDEAQGQPGQPEPPQQPGNVPGNSAGGGSRGSGGGQGRGSR